MRKDRNFHRPLITATVLMVLLIAVLAGTGTWVLHSINTQLAHETVTKTVLDRGKTIVSRLAYGASEDAGVKDLSRQFRSLCALEDGLQYISVKKDDLVVFQEQRKLLDTSQPHDNTGSAVELEKIELDKKLLSFAGEMVPVVVFRTSVKGVDGKNCVVEIAIKRDTVNKEEALVRKAISAMARVALLTIGAGFFVSIIVVVWMMRREHRRELQRRSEEHLAFAGVMANGIVHDFRNPMSSLRLDLQMLGKEAGKGADCRLERVTELTQSADKTITRMDKVFKEFLYLSKPLAEAEDDVDLAACVKDCTELLKARFEEQGIILKSDLIDEPVIVRGFQTSIQRALMNVLTNAEQFSVKGGKVDVGLKILDSNAVITIMDRGPGIDEKDIGNIFEMFTTTRPEGSGLGLFLARTAIERCGGTINFENRESGGACFTIMLPLLFSKEM